MCSRRRRREILRATATRRGDTAPLYHRGATWSRLQMKPPEQCMRRSTSVGSPKSAVLFQSALRSEKTCITFRTFPNDELCAESECAHLILLLAVSSGLDLWKIYRRVMFCAHSSPFGRRATALSLCGVNLWTSASELELASRGLSRGFLPWPFSSLAHNSKRTHYDAQRRFSTGSTVARVLGENSNSVQGLTRRALRFCLASPVFVNE